MERAINCFKVGASLRLCTISFAVALLLLCTSSKADVYTEYIDKLCIRFKVPKVSAIYSWSIYPSLSAGAYTKKSNNGPIFYFNDGWLSKQSPKTQRSVMLHEFAHYIHDLDFDKNKDVSIHGKTFCETLYRVIAKTVGVKGYDWTTEYDGVRGYIFKYLVRKKEVKHDN